jgi:hypothetical protein
MPADTDEPLLICDLEAARICGVCRVSWHRFRAAGKLPPSIGLGRCVRWRRNDVLLRVEWGCPDARGFEDRLASRRPLKVC